MRVRIHHGAAREKLIQDHGLEADLVVDASGRDSQAPRWLEALGYEAPPESTVQAYVGYASRCYRLPARRRPRWKALMVQAAPPRDLRGGMILAWEDDRWIVTLQGSGRDYPPTDEAGFLEFARSLRSPLLYEAIRAAEPLSPICGWRKTENRFRHYERLSRGPAGFIVLGDAVCTFNPVYGQGMTTAARGAELLDEILRGQDGRPSAQRQAELCRRFQKKLARRIEDAWLLATSEDHRVPVATGDPPGPFTALLHRYVDRVMALGVEDRRACRTFSDVLTLIRPATALFSPRILVKVILRAITGRRPVEVSAPREPLPAGSVAVAA